MPEMGQEESIGRRAGLGSESRHSRVMAWTVKVDPWKTSLSGMVAIDSRVLGTLHRLTPDSPSFVCHATML